MRDTFTRCLEAYAENHPELVLVTGDLGFGVLFPYMKKFPDRFIKAGIAEQAMMSMAAGLALEGKTVVVYSIGNFPTLRCLEQIRNCCAYHDVNVKIVCVGAGFVYGTLGMTHHATEDMSALRLLPGVKVYAPADGVETEAVMGPFLSEPGVAYLRIGRGGETHYHDSIEGYRCGQALEQFPGTDAYILTAGGILGSAVEAAEMLKEKNLSIPCFDTSCDLSSDPYCVTFLQTLLTVRRLGYYTGMHAGLMCRKMLIRLFHHVLPLQVAEVSTLLRSVDTVITVQQHSGFFTQGVPL